ncbi:MAG: GDP-mannose 4,6-dehydratase [Thermoproteales archaeon]|nr:GDP-mannose 4,6-dehydratase [Thermoproteales archaeon]
MNIYPNEKILITGTSGFIGSHLLEYLKTQELDIYLLQRYVTGRYVQGTNVKTVFADLRNSVDIKNVVRMVQPDYVIHFAAISPVAYSYTHPQETIETNFLGTVNLAEGCLREVPHFKQFLFASTSETYGNGPVPKREDTVQVPNSPYAVGKLAAEKYLLYMKEAYDFPITILRNFNTYGRKRNKHFFVERTITQMLTSDVVKLGDPTPVRDFIYVDDHVNAYLTCLGNEKAIGEIFNFCTGKKNKLIDVVDLISKLTDFEGDVKWYTIPARPLDIKVLYGDYSKAKNMLGWYPKYSLEEGLKLTTRYWKKKLQVD